MLAQNFKSPAELGILDREFSALVTTLGMLERGELIHAPSNGAHKRARRFTGHFNMNNWAHETECGSVCCIGGTAELIGQFEFAEDSETKLHALFFPSFEGVHAHYRDITPEQAARALRSFLSTGRPNWADAVR